MGYKPTILDVNGECINTTFGRYRVSDYDNDELMEIKFQLTEKLKAAGLSSHEHVRVADSISGLENILNKRRMS